MPEGLRQIRRIIYTLKRRFGVQIKYYRPGDPVIDLKTGVVTQTFTTYTINRAIVGTGKEMMNNIYNIFSPGFPTAAFFDQDIRVVLIDAADLSITPDKKDHIQVNSERLEINEIHPPQNNRAYWFVCKAVKNAELVA